MKKTVIVLGALVLCVVIVWTSVTEPGIKDLNGNFKEVAFARNEQNSGPVIRYYAVTVEGTLWEEMEQYGDYMPHTKYGTTRVYFFESGKPYPSTISMYENPIPKSLGEFCVALYEKDGMNQTKLTRYPFKNGVTDVAGKMNLLY